MKTGFGTNEVLQDDGGCSHLDLPVAPLEHIDTKFDESMIECHALHPLHDKHNLTNFGSVGSAHLVGGVDGQVDLGAVLDPHLRHLGPVLVQHSPLMPG